MLWCDNSFYVTQQVSHLRCALLNVRSLKNKCYVVSEYITDHNIDILCLTESWINDNISDLLCLNSATPSAYSFISVPRKSDRGGGLVLIYKSSLRVRLKPSLNNDSFESMLAEVVYDHIQMGMILVYRPPSENFSTFLTEFGKMVTPLLIENSSRVLCLGDFNIHVDQENDLRMLRAKAFNSLLSEIGLLQHVCFPTHEKGHTLDLVLTDVRHPPLLRGPGPTLQGYVQSDHYPLCFDITCPQPHKPSKIIQFHKWSNLDLEHFKSKLSPNLADITATSDVNTMVDVYNQTLKSCLDDLLPVRSKTITEHFNCPYYNDEIRATKQRRRKLEMMTMGMKLQMVFHVMILPKGLIIILSRGLTTYVTILSTPSIWQTLTIPWCPHLLRFLYRHLNMSQRKRWTRQCSHDLLNTVHLTQFQHGFWRTLLTS